MNNVFTDHQGRKLVPLRIDERTTLLVPEEQATEARAKKFRENMERQDKIRTRVINGGYFG